MLPVKTLVIGAGLGGLCLAQGLRRAGLDVAVFERDRSPEQHSQDYRIHLNSQGARALRRRLPPPLWDRFAAASAHDQQFRFLTEQLECLLTLDLAPCSHSVSRILLRQLLLHGMDGTVHFDKTFQRYEIGPSGRITAHFEDGSTANGDLLVAADGNRSRVRRQYLPHAERRDTGVRGIVGKVIFHAAAKRNLHPRFLQGSGLVLAPRGVSMFFAPQRLEYDDYLLWALTSRSHPRETDGAALKTEALRQIRGWHPAFSGLVAGSQAASISCLEIRTSSPIGPWPASRVTLLGDAIHGMTPYRGIGASAALQDADALCAQLENVAHGGKSLLDAIAAYEAGMRDYGFAAVRKSASALKRAAGGALSLACTRTFLRTAHKFPSLRRWFFRDLMG